MAPRMVCGHNIMIEPKCDNKNTAKKRMAVLNVPEAMLPKCGEVAEAEAGAMCPDVPEIVGEGHAERVQNKDSTSKLLKTKSFQALFALNFQM